jgi:hypothetical protein
MKKLILLLTLCTFLISSEYSKWLEERNSEFIHYKKTIDEEFTDMLKKDWQAFKTMYNPTPYIKPKPIELPTIKKEIQLPKKELKKSVIVKLKIPKKIIPIEKNIIEKKIPQIIKPKLIPNFEATEIDFYSTILAIQYDPKTNFTLHSINNESISRYWDKINQTKYKILIKQIKQYSNSLQFNDWATYLLTYKVGYKIYQDNNMANLFSWFIMSKMHYDVKVGYNDNDIYLMSTIKHKLYQVAFFTLKTKRYYVLTPKGRIKKLDSIYTYKGRYPNTINSLNFEFASPIKISSHMQSRNLDFVYESHNYDLNASYSRDLVNFYKTFPQSDYRVYFKTTSVNTANSLLKQLRPIVENKSELEAVNILLRFVQTSFKYKTDFNQFTYEKVFFPEETLFYEYSDCEDRSIIFSFLVKELTGLDVVAIKFSNHLATAVAFSSYIKGDSFNFNNKRYTMTDPTYINANVGMSMPKYANSTFKIIP